MIPVHPAMIIAFDTALKDVLRAIDGGARGIALVLDAQRRLAGVVTDYDVRKAILDGIGLDHPIERYVNRAPVMARADSPKEELYELMRTTGKAPVPLVDAEGRLVGLETLFTVLDDGTVRRHDHVAIIMAGGMGTRLRPLTTSTPKPLLPIRDKPLLRIIIEDLKRYGFHRFYLTLHYGADQIERQFGDGEALDVSIQYIREEKPLGTAGALALLPADATELPFLVMNGDLLTRVNFESLLSFHTQSQHHMTVCIRRHGTEIPYGVVELQDDRVIGVREKPQQVCFINAGIYVLDREVLALIPAGRRYDVTELINASALQGSGVASFPIHEYWLDIGGHSDYERAHAEYERYF